MLTSHLLLCIDYHVRRLQACRNSGNRRVCPTITKEGLNSNYRQNAFIYRTPNAGVAVRTADGSRWTANAGDEQCLRCGCSSPSCSVVLCAADIDGPLHTACRVYVTVRCLSVHPFVRLSVCPIDRRLHRHD